jgi:hypothetical protein
MTARARKEQLCDWCFDPLYDVAVECNGGLGHPWCAENTHNHLCWPSDPPLPWRPTMRRFYRPDPSVVFLKRLGYEAARLGIDPQKLATAAARAGR